MRTTGKYAFQILDYSVDDLSERIEIIYQSTKRNSVGDIVGTEENIRCKVWAKVLPLTARRILDDSETINEISYRITIRYRRDIMPDDLILWRGKRLRQTAPPYDAESRKIWTVLTCTEMIKDGKS